MIINYCSKPKGGGPAPEPSVPTEVAMQMNSRYIPCDLQPHTAGTSFQYVALHPTDSLWNGSKIVDTSIGLKIEAYNNKTQIKITYNSKEYIVNKGCFIRLPEVVTLTSNVTVSDDGPIGLSMFYMDINDIEVTNEKAPTPSSLITLQAGAEFQYAMLYSNQSSSDVSYSGFFNFELLPYYRRVRFGDRTILNLNLGRDTVCLPLPFTIPTNTTIQTNANTAIKAGTRLS